MQSGLVILWLVGLLPIAGCMLVDPPLEPNRSVGDPAPTATSRPATSVLGSGVVITYTSYRVDAYGEHVIQRRHRASILDYDRFRIDSQPEPGITTTVGYGLYARDGVRWISLSDRADGSRHSQTGRRLEHRLPDIVDAAVTAGYRPLLGPDLDALVAWYVPLIGWDRIHQLVADGRVELGDRMWLQGFLTRQLLVDVAGDQRVVWVDEEVGLKLRIEDYEGSSLKQFLDTQAIALDTDLSDTDFAPAFRDDAIAEFVETFAFTDTARVQTPGVSGLLHPGLEPIHGSISLRASTYLTGTVLGWREFDPQAGNPRGWLIGQVLDDGAGDIEIAVIQGDDRGRLPVNIDAYWPPTWPEAGPASLSHEMYSSDQARTLEDGTPVMLATANASSQPSAPKLEYNHVVTWVEPVRNRIVFCVRGAASSDEALALASAYRVRATR